MMKAESIALEDLDEAQVLRLVAETGWIRRRVAYAAFIARRFVRFLIDWDREAPVAADGRGNRED